MKRTLIIGGCICLLVAGVMLIERLNQDTRYRSLLAEGEVALLNRRSYVAIEAFSGALALRPDSMVALYRRGEAYADQSQDENAIRDLEEAWRLAPDAPQPPEALGHLYDRRGDAAAAAEWYALASDRLHDSDPTVLYALALARYRAGAPAAAREPLRLALARNDAFPEAHYLLGLVSRDTRDFDESIASLERAVRLAPQLLAAREELADLYRSQGRAADERVQLAALADADQQPGRQVTLALADVRGGRLNEALTSLARAQGVAPDDSRVALALGRIYLADAELTGAHAPAARALATLEKALGGTAPRSEGVALFARALYLTGDAAGAERLLLDAIATSPVDPEAFAFLADAAERQSHPAIACDALQKLDALEGDTSSVNARTARGRRIGALALAAGDWHTSIDALTTAVASGYDDAVTLGLLARARWRSGDLPGARSALGRALARDGHNTDLRRLARIIH
ncbi:MAG: tetratricopeptide repeat protein [Vicinamibacterales bacterium]